MPTEHGGWSFTLEPVVLGLLVAPSIAGALLGVAALVAFLARTPLKVVLVDRFRGRHLARTQAANRVLAIELVVIALLGLGAALLGDGPWWAPILAAIPLIGLELWFDMRSRSRRLLPELAGTVGIGAIAAAIVLADGETWALALGMWAVMASRSVAAVGFVRIQLRRLKHQPYQMIDSDLLQVVAVVAVVIAWSAFDVPVAGVIAIVVLVGFHLVASRLPAPQPAILGGQQIALGLGVVVTTALGVLAP